MAFRNATSDLWTPNKREYTTGSQVFTHLPSQACELIGRWQFSFNFFKVPLGYIYCALDKWVVSPLLHEGHLSITHVIFLNMVIWCFYLLYNYLMKKVWKAQIWMFLTKTNNTAETQSTTRVCQCAAQINLRLKREKTTGSACRTQSEHQVFLHFTTCIITANEWHTLMLLCTHTCISWWWCYLKT